MANEYRNLGPVTKAQIMRDVTNNNNYARDSQQTITTNYFNRIVMPTVQPTTISFKNIPEPHASFVGRVQYIKSAIKYLTHPVVADVQIQFPCFVIHALGGYGKTQTARKIASKSRRKRKFQHFIWIDSEDDLSLKKCFVVLMKQIGLDASDESDATNFEWYVDQFYKILASRKKEKFLIIFDNVEDFDNILRFLPLNHRAKTFAVLMTSQRPFTRASYGNIRNRQLDLLPEEEAIKLVEKILGTSTLDSAEDKKLLVERSERIALVLCVMTSTIENQRRSKRDYKIGDYLKEMYELPIQYSDETNSLDLDYKKSLQKIVRFAVNKLAVGGPIEKISVKVFNRLAYFSSTNLFDENFVDVYFWDICMEAKNVDMKLPMKPVDGMQIIRIAIEKLSEFSLVQIVDDKLTVHRWIQASRRLDLKDSGDDRTVVKELLFIAKNMPNFFNSIDWQHVIDYTDIVREFYAKQRTLLKFPICNVDMLGRIIRELTQAEDFELFENYSKEVIEIILTQIPQNYNPHMIRRTMNVLNYAGSKESTELLSRAISVHNVDVVKWLLNVNPFIVEEAHLRQCFESARLVSFSFDLHYLKEFSIKLIEKRPGKNIFERAFSKLKSLRARRIATISEISYVLSALADSDSLKIRLCEMIEKCCGKNILERILHSAAKKVNLEPESLIHRIALNFVKTFEIIKAILNTLKLDPSIELDNIKRKYSEKSLIECLFICGRSHCFCVSKKRLVVSPYSIIKKGNLNDVHRAAYENNVLAIQSMDPTLVESKTKTGRTPLMYAVGEGACEVTTILLENYSANVNASDNLGDTPLAMAIKYLHPSICKILLSHGAKIHWKNKSGESVHALHEAVRSFKRYDGPEPEEIAVEVLTSTDCDVCATNYMGDNILHMLVRYYYATKYNPNHRILQILLSANASLINTRNNDGTTPLQLAKKLKSEFFDDHWHVESLQSFISEVNRVSN